MALTIYNTPYSYAPAYNQMIFTLESDKPLIEYVNLSLEYNKLQFSVLNNFVQIE